VNLEPFNVSGDTATTCVEECKGRDAFYSIFVVSNEQCICSNRPTIINRHKGKECKEDADSNDEKYNVTNLSKYILPCLC